jgi:A/G-specific adenine glycosylase
MSRESFRRTVLDYHKKEGRHDLPWRKTKDVYRILVSEVMLQQTQVERVIPFYKNFIQKFPTAKSLAAAPLADVLKAWQGLGYNRRAKMLHAAAKEHVSKKFNTVAELEALPGVGPYTARAIAAFAWNEDVIFIETNIRTVVIHHFFASGAPRVSDAEIIKILEKTLPKGRAREWYSALMDYGAALKRSGISYNARSAKYVKQSKFAGSLREVRGAILRLLSEKSVKEVSLYTLFPKRQAQVDTALAALVKEGLIRKQKGKYSLAEE